VLLAACGDSDPRLLPIEPGATIIAFGDSLTHGTGTGAGAEDAYPAVLAELTGLQVINAGVPGELSAEAAKRLPALLRRYQPALVILCHGGNDMLRRLDSDALYDNLSSMVDAIRAGGADVILVGVPKLKLLFLEPADLYDRLAAQKGLVYLRDTLPELESDPAMKSDPIHLNAAGYRELAEAIEQLMYSAGGLGVR
jgi:lysophospholipase L1-like esterase